MNADYVSQQIAIASNTNFSSKEAEQSVIYCLVNGGKDVSSNIDALNDKDFYFDSSAKIFNAIKLAYAKGLAVDLVTVDASIGQLYPTEYSTLGAELISCINLHYSVANVESYIAIVKKLSERRQSIRSIDTIAALLRDPSQNVDDVLNRLKTDTRNIETSKCKVENMIDVMLSTFEYIEKRSKGEMKSITTGIKNVDNLIGGFFGGELTVIGARPSVGKSAFGANIALEAAKSGFKVAFLSREMSDVQFGQRMLSNVADIDGMKMRKAELTDDDWKQMTEAMAPLSELPIKFIFSMRTVEELRKECQSMKDENAIDLLIVDYLQLMHTEKPIKEEHLRIGYISKSLKDLAVDLDIPVIALAQVNRDTDGMMPSLKSLKASGDIEQDADGVIFLHRPETANDIYIDKRDRQNFEAYANSGMKYICINVAKQRQGATGGACVMFDAAHMRYYEIKHDE